MISMSAIASPGTQIVTIVSGSNEPEMPYGFRRQLPIIQQSLNDLNLPPNLFNILATMAVAKPTGERYDENYSPQSPEPSNPSPISTPPMNVSTIDGWQTPHTTMDGIVFYSNDEPRRIYFLDSSPSPSPPPKLEKKTDCWNVLPKKRGVTKHVCEACGQLLPEPKDIPGPSSKN